MGAVVLFLAHSDVPNCDIFVCDDVYSVFVTAKCLFILSRCCKVAGFCYVVNHILMYLIWCTGL